MAAFTSPLCSLEEKLLSASLAESLQIVRPEEAATPTTVGSESDGQQSLMNGLGDDLIVAILCHLAPAELATCACISRRFRDLYNDDSKLWLPLCEHRWGAVTAVQKWGGRGRQRGAESVITYRKLHAALEILEQHLGIWRGTSREDLGTLVIFEWRSSYMEGLKVVPATRADYSVKCLPFLRVGVATKGFLNYQFNTEWRDGTWGGRGDFKVGESREERDRDSKHVLERRLSGNTLTINRLRENGSNFEGFSPSSPPINFLRRHSYSSLSPWLTAEESPSHIEATKLLSPSSTGKLHASPSPTTANFNDRNWQTVPLSGSLDCDLPEWNPDDELPPGILPVSFKVVSRNHILIEEAVGEAPGPLGRCQVAVDAALASFGSGEHLAELMKSPPTSQAGFQMKSWRTSPVQNSPPYVGEAEAGSHSLPGILPFEMYTYLASRVAPSGGENFQRKQKRKEKLRSRSAAKGRVGLPPFESEHLLRVREDLVCPTEERPFQGLWKGIGEDGDLDFVLVSYDAPGSIVCRRMAKNGPVSGESIGNNRGGVGSSGNSVGSVKWTAMISSRKATPLSLSERSFYQRRRHLAPPRSVKHGNNSGGLERYGRGGRVEHRGRESGACSSEQRVDECDGSGLILREEERGRGALGLSTSNHVEYRGASNSRGRKRNPKGPASEADCCTEDDDGKEEGGGGGGGEGESPGGREEVFQFEDGDVKMYGEEEEVMEAYLTVDVWDPEMGLGEHPMKGRLWLYESGNFGYAAGHADHVVDYTRMVANGALVDMLANVGRV